MGEIPRLNLSPTLFFTILALEHPTLKDRNMPLLQLPISRSSQFLKNRVKALEYPVYYMSTGCLSNAIIVRMS